MRFILLFILVFFIGENAAAQKADRFYVPYSESKISIDTISSGVFSIPVGDSTLISFEMSVWGSDSIGNGIEFNRVLERNNIPPDVLFALRQLVPGSKIYIDNIRISAGNNRTYRAQNRLYYVQ